MKIDARGLSCPQPVLLTKNAMDDNQTNFDIIVDNPTALNNIIRFVSKQKGETKVTEDEGCYTITVSK